MTVEEICRDLPNLWPEDVSESLRYAAKAVRERQLAAAPIGVRLLLDDNLPCGLSVGKLGLECVLLRLVCLRHGYPRPPTVRTALGSS